jgi:hypothetical protein
MSGENLNGKECKMRDGQGNFVVWTEHLTTFVVYDEDDIPPTTNISVSGMQGNNDWFTSDAQVTLSATDNEGGSGVAKTEYSLDGGNTWNDYASIGTLTDEGKHTIAYRSVDNVGNLEYFKTQEIDIDKSGPEININTPSDGSQYVLNSQVNADWNVSDGLSGVDESSGSVASGDVIDTGTAGEKEFIVTAKDKAGNSNSKTVHYKIVYRFGGFLNPIKDTKTFNGNSTIPVKFQLTDAAGNFIPNATAHLQVDGQPAMSSGNANNGDVCRYSSADNQYVYNLSLKNLKLKPGTHTLKLILDDGATYEQGITVK